jgi:hypothetical protein
LQITPHTKLVSIADRSLLRPVAVDSTPTRLPPEEIQHHALGSRGRTAREEFIGLFLYLLTLAGFLYWLLAEGVNV